jgi:very-short-patch-repair endonuclease
MDRPQDNARRHLLKRDRAREFRSQMTDAECKLWARLCGKKMAGLRFRRQEAIGPYIADFYCSAAKLVVELDGGQHGNDDVLLYDVARTLWLNDSGYRVLRFSNHDFLRDPEFVIEGIWRAVVESACPLPEALRASTLPQGEGG